MTARRAHSGIAILAVLGACFGTQPATAQQPLVSPYGAVAMAATVHELRGCIRGIPAADRFLLALRFGIGGRPQKTDAEVATRLHTTVATVATRETIAVRRLAEAQRRGACRGGHVVASAASSAPAALNPLGAAGSSRPSGGGGLSSNDLLAGAVILAALVVAGREFRKAIFGPPPPR